MKKILDRFTPRRMFDLDKFEFDDLIIEHTLILDIIDFAKANYPNEFMAFLKGKFENKMLILEGLLYQKFESSRTSAFTRIALPNGLGVVGSVHSHPSPNSNPSGQDRIFFSKFGGVHLIISYPYRKEDLRVYDIDGERIGFKVRH